MTTKATVSALVGLALASVLGTANAAFQSCTGPGYDISDNVVPNEGCTILLPLDADVNDSVSPPPSTYTVNVEEFFGFDDWQFDGKWEETQGVFVDSSDLYNFTGDGQSGTFTSIEPFPTDITNVLFVFKDGGNTNLVGYLIEPGADGTYTSPFVEPPFTFEGEGPRDISHISVYFREGENGGPPTEIPAPGSLALLALGLLGLGISLRRRFV